MRSRRQPHETDQVVSRDLLLPSRGDSHDEKNAATRVRRITRTRPLSCRATLLAQKSPVARISPNRIARPTRAPPSPSGSPPGPASGLPYTHQVIAHRIDAPIGLWSNIPPPRSPNANAARAPRAAFD